MLVPTAGGHEVLVLHGGGLVLACHDTTNAAAQQQVRLPLALLALIVSALSLPAHASSGGGRQWSPRLRLLTHAVLQILLMVVNLGDLRGKEHQMGLIRLLLLELGFQNCIFIVVSK